MHTTLAIAKLWPIAASLIAALGVGVMTAAEAVSPPPAAPAEAPSEEKNDQMLDVEVSIDLLDSELVDAAKLLEKMTALTFTVDPQVLAAKPPTVTLKTDRVKLRSVLDVMKRLTGLSYQIVDNAVVFSIPKEPSSLFPPDSSMPIIRLAVSNMFAEDVAIWIGKLSDTTISIDPTLRHVRIEQIFDDVPLSESLDILAKLTNGQVITSPGSFYQIVTHESDKPTAPPMPSAAQ